MLCFEIKSFWDEHSKYNMFKICFHVFIIQVLSWLIVNGKKYKLSNIFPLA